MNEFIVWDKKHKTFTTDIDLETDLRLEGIGYSMIIDNDIFETFTYIGKTDDTPEQNKIYADCSIVELKLFRMDVKVLGYFHFNNETMRIEFKQYFEKLKKFLGCYVPPEEFEHLKVIGTLKDDDVIKMKPTLESEG